jgi:WD40 repeat protein
VQQHLCVPVQVWTRGSQSSVAAAPSWQEACQPLRLVRLPASDGSDAAAAATSKQKQRKAQPQKEELSVDKVLWVADDSKVGTVLCCGVLCYSCGVLCWGCAITLCSVSRSSKKLANTSDVSIKSEKGRFILITACLLLLQLLVAGSDLGIRVWSTRDWSLQALLRGHSQEVHVLSGHPCDSRLVLSAGHDGRSILWDTETGQELRR